MLRIFLNFNPIWLCFIFNQNIFTEIYINPPSYYWRCHYHHHYNQQVKYATDDMFLFSSKKKVLDLIFPYSLIFIPPSDKAPGLLTSTPSCHCLVASNPLTPHLSLFSPKWASGSVIVGTCKCPVLALHVENTVIGLGLCGTKRTVRLQLILLHPVSSCV